MAYFKFANRDPVITDDPHYDLFEGGYIKPEELLTDPEQLVEVEKAVQTIETFFREAEEAGMLEYT